MRSTISPSCDLAISHAIMAAKMLPRASALSETGETTDYFTLRGDHRHSLAFAHGAFDAARSTSFTPTPTSKTPLSLSAI